MLSVVKVNLSSKVPVVGSEVSASIFWRLPDGSIRNDDDSVGLRPIHGYHFVYKWYRLKSDKTVAVCYVHSSEQATLQCLACVKAKIPVAYSYHCSSRCFSESWEHHRALHERAAFTLNENGNEEEETSGNFDFGSSIIGTSLSSSKPSIGQNPGLNNGSAHLYPTAIAERNNGATWLEVGCSKTYTPTVDDIGHILKFDCLGVNAKTKVAAGDTKTFLTSRVQSAPIPSPRCLISVSKVDVTGRLDFDSSSGTFTVLSYNILSDVYATSELYSYCPFWALSWFYRRQNLLREILGYNADILCLQEIQNDQFEEFFKPELDKHGYQALYKKKTTEVCNGNASAIDGCATFFRRDKLSHVKKYEVEFNKAAQSVTDQIAPGAAQKRTALDRMLKDNIALIAVLEPKFSNHVADPSGKKRLLCVANTHIHVHQDLMDVKLWQVQTLLRGLEKIAVSADISMLVCGDFNSTPGSAPHTLLATGKVDQMHPDLVIDPLGILHPTNNLRHQLPLVSAYSSFAIPTADPGIEKQKSRMDLKTNEPFFTNCTRDFLGTVDYIFYSADSLMVESLLELVDVGCLQRETGLPSPACSSDHIALLAEFRFMPRMRL
ncbi:hypothetical protein GIB67_010430 [Kingdonia uniflora]|uniref:poly(A)-specific ribonuclease n=1 Tax=Kingdonia uniflora TaxID=39325 RepID=A0A7J7MAC9_9MAGN|nr:hypothetical protein GIB67_010430 [Kingdonia uniflora]